MKERVLVAGIGNIFLGDDGFGSEVASALAAEGLPAHVRLVDYGIRGMHLAYDLLDGFAALVLVDAIPGEQRPGAVHVLEITEEHLETHGGLDAHGMHPGAVLASCRMLGGRLPRTFLVGCRPERISEGIGLSAPVAQAVPTALAAIRSLLEHELADLAATAG
ncbi:hydrogenase maturation protease [Sciscionella marina]|uniref:hydrogenase maturation protease n=1 Tax=Sciscionella marina TaxID=508770 RepID=UPI000380DFE2|nr:hydrogenase maturation protease [Sciscionella marina]